MNTFKWEKQRNKGKILDTSINGFMIYFVECYYINSEKNTTISCQHLNIV